MMFSISSRKSLKQSDCVINTLRSSIIALALVVVLAAGPIQAQELVDSVQFESTPSIQDGVAIAGDDEEKEDGAVTAVIVDPNVTVETIRLGGTTIREYRTRGRIVRIEVTPEGGIPSYVGNSTNLLSDHTSFTNRDNRRVNNFLISTW